jgi:hypothetical protein
MSASEVTMSKSSLIAAALLATPAPAVAQIVFVDAPPIAPPTKAERMKSDTDKIECRAENPLGTRLGRHQVCLTKDQWWAYEQEARQRVQEWGRLGSSNH